MKLMEIIHGQAIRLIQLHHPNGGIYIPEVLKKIESRYGFVEMPTKLTDFDPSKGITFLHGKFGDLVIKKFQIFNDGVVAESAAPIEMVDEFIDDLLIWSCTDLGCRVRDDLPVVRAYHSQIEVQFDRGLQVEKFSKLGQEIVKTLKSYGQNPPNFELAGIQLYGEIHKIPLPRPGPFKIERREGRDYSHSLYFCSAPLRTTEHVKLLEYAETILRT